MELRLQHIEDDLPERERWGHGPWDRHEMSNYRMFIGELKALRKDCLAMQEKGGHDGD